MNRLEKIREFVHELILNVQDKEIRRIGYVHLYGVSQFCAQLALKRNLNPEIAAITGMLHDIYYIRTGIGDNHAHNGAEYVRPILRDIGIFKQEEQKIILSAIFHHSDKKSINGEYDELLKDADVLQHFLYNTKFDIYEKEVERLKNIFKEINLNNITDYDLNYEKKDEKTIVNINKRECLADIAETLAKREMVGEEYDEDYKKIVRYWPEVNSHEELKHSWCAAFVYHCCFEAGFILPIKHPNTDTRYAGIVGWFQWASLPEVDFYIEDREEFVPQRGDIVVYNNLIPKEYKQPNDILPRDHIGIVLSSDKDSYIVAEGNVDNQNKAGIVTRKLHENVDGFIRISNDYEYTAYSWKYDYKTGEYKDKLDTN